MKLFKSLLVAPATLGLLAPLAATANEVTINDFNSAEEIAVTNSRVDGLEAKINNLEAGGFSDTTTMDGKAIFTLGAVEYDDESGSEAVQAYYSYTMNLNTSFTGDDNLYVRVKTGNGADFPDSKTYGTYLSSNKGNG